MAGKFFQMGGGGHIYFGHIFFVTVSFEPESKTLFRVLFQACVFRFSFISVFTEYFIFLARPVKRTSKQSAVYILGVWKNRKSILQIKVLPGLHVHQAIYGQVYTWRVRASKNPIF
jgi:hypothetical protein